MQAAGTQHATILLQHGRVVQTNPLMAELVGLSQAELGRMSQDGLVSLAHPDQAEPFMLALQAAGRGEFPLPLPGLCLRRQDGDRGDLEALITPVLYAGELAVQVLLIDHAASLADADALRLATHRLQALRDIEQAALLAQGEPAAARAALRGLADLVPGYQSSALALVDLATHSGHLLACHPLEDGCALAESFALGPYLSELEAVRSGRLALVDELEAAPELKTMAAAFGLPGGPAWRAAPAWLVAPVLAGEQLLGLLSIATGQPSRIDERHLQAVREIAASLAVAFQHQRLARAEDRRRREAGVMRDMMAALAAAGDLKQTLEAVLVNLHNLIDYDRAGLFLVDENQRFIVTERPDSPGPAHLDEDPLVREMRRARQVMVVADVQADPRFAGWPDLQPLRGWLGAPLLIGDEMIGFLSLGSLQEAAYGPADAETMQFFALQVAEVLEKAWLNEQTQRRTQELEVLSSISFALEQAEGGGNTLAVILGQLARFFEASQGAFVLADRAGSALTIKACLDETAVGQAHSYADDPLWRALDSQQTSVLPQVGDLLAGPAASFYRCLLGDAQAAVFIPLQTGDMVFGLLCFGFPSRSRLTAANLRLYRAVAEIAGASLRRAVVLEALERQVSIRTQHLSTLYDINALASEPLELQTVLEQVLSVTLDSMKSSIGAIHFMDEKSVEFYLVAQQNLPAELLPDFENLPLRDPFWRSLSASTNPLVIPDVRTQPDIPAQAGKLGWAGAPAYIGAPIRSKGQTLGLLSLFGKTIQDFTIEDITLFMTIADQIGGSVERARLTRKAELAAVVQERQRLARELHDSVTQLLYSQVLFSGAALKVVHQGNLPMAEQYLARIDQAARQALKEMRLLIYQLRSPDTADEGLADALARRLDAVEKRTGVNARLLVEGNCRLEPATEMAIYRIAEEALNNTLKHAQAANVSVRLARTPGRFDLEISDDGRGFVLAERENSGGMGLANLRLRAAALGGSLEIHTQPGSGTRVSLSIEVPE